MQISYSIYYDKSLEEDEALNNLCVLHGVRVHTFMIPSWMTGGMTVSFLGPPKETDLWNIY